MCATRPAIIVPPPVAVVDFGTPGRSIVHAVAPRVAGEYTGLAAALLRAGAPAVIATLWNVDDLASSLLMRRFYDGPVRRALPPDAALREAQLWLRSVTVAELATQEAGRRRPTAGDYWPEPRPRPRTPARTSGPATS